MSIRGIHDDERDVNLHVDGNYIQDDRNNPGRQQGMLDQKQSEP